MSAPEHVSLTLSEYVRQVEQACSDLQPPVRHRLLADLEAHLRDQADGADLVATLGEPGPVRPRASHGNGSAGGRACAGLC